MLGYEGVGAGYEGFNANYEGIVPGYEHSYKYVPLVNRAVHPG